MFTKSLELTALGILLIQDIALAASLFMLQSLKPGRLDLLSKKIVMEDNTIYTKVHAHFYL